MSQQCVYREGRRRCTRNGSGNPRLCHPHRIVVQEQAARAEGQSPLEDLLESVITGKRVAKDKIDRAIDEVFAAFGGVRWMPPPVVEQTEPVPPRRQVDPEVRDRARRILAALRQLGLQPPDPVIAKRLVGDLVFKRPQDAITVDGVRDVRKKLARKYHPDRGGSTEKMAQVNDAADVLLAALAT